MQLCCSVKWLGRSVALCPKATNLILKRLMIPSLGPCILSASAMMKCLAYSPKLCLLKDVGISFGVFPCSLNDQGKEDKLIPLLALVGACENEAFPNCSSYEKPGFFLSYFCPLLCSWFFLVLDNQWYLLYLDLDTWLRTFFFLIHLCIWWWWWYGFMVYSHFYLLSLFIESPRTFIVLLERMCLGKKKYIFHVLSVISLPFE